MALRLRAKLASVLDKEGFVCSSVDASVIVLVIAGCSSSAPLPMIEP